MNKADAERVAGLLTAAGWKESPEDDEADVVLVNGCVVRAKAEEKAIQRVRQLIGAKKGRRVALIGCAAQWRGAELLDELPGLHLVASPARLGEVPDLIETGGAALGHIPWRGSCTSVRRDPGIKAWIPIMRGCDQHCTFCVVPRTRGPEVSFPPSYVMELAADAVGHGRVELDLLGQRVSAYRHGNVSFGALVRKLAHVPGVRRIRFTAPYPADIGMDLLHVMAGEPGVEHRLHLPLQSGSNRVLGRMRRGYTVEDYLVVVERARSLMPDFGLSTDIIVGFPGESEEDFRLTESLVRTIGFDTAFTFLFSPRRHTPAESMDGQVPREEARERLTRLIETHHAALRQRLAGCVGQQVEVLIERWEDPLMSHSIGKACNGRVVHVAGRHTIGALVSATVTSLQGHTLCAVPRERGGTECGSFVGS